MDFEEMAAVIIGGAVLLWFIFFNIKRFKSKTERTEIREEAAREEAYINQLEQGNVAISSNHMSECPICFENLFSCPSSVLLDRRENRICKHFFHEECINTWIASNKSCPICKRSCECSLQVPNPYTDAEAWFRVVDMNGDGKLDKSEVLDVLEAQLPINFELLRAHIDGLWPSWDADGNGYISKDELIRNDGGLLNYVRYEFPFEEELVPDLLNDMIGWFHFWDQDSSGSLEKWEVIRALAKTFKGMHTQCSLRFLRDLKDTVTEVWPAFDINGDGAIDVNEFCSSGGLGETIKATFIAMSETIEQ